MENILTALSDWIVAASDAVCGYPEFFLLIGGGLFLFIFSGLVSARADTWITPGSSSPAILYMLGIIRSKP